MFYIAFPLVSCGGMLGLFSITEQGLSLLYETPNVYYENMKPSPPLNPLDIPILTIVLHSPK